LASDRKAVWGEEPKPLMPYSPAIKAGGWVFFAGQLASDFKTGVAPEAGGDGRNPYAGNRLELQSRFVMDNLKRTAEAAGIDIGKDIMRIYQWFTSPHPTMDEFAEGNTWPRISITPYLDTRNEFIFEPRPASTGGGSTAPGASQPNSRSIADSSAGAAYMGARGRVWRRSSSWSKKPSVCSRRAGYSRSAPQSLHAPGTTPPWGSPKSQ